MSEKERKIRHLTLGGILGDRTIRNRLRPEYREACRFFACPLIDRTATLDAGAGIDFEILDPLPDFTKIEESFESICASRARFIAEKAVGENRKVQLLWSGGIDSTLALVSLYRNLKEAGALNCLEVLLSKESVNEYPSFYKEVVRPDLKHAVFEPPIYPHLDAAKIVVTGEHGDQLFGSDKAKDYVIAGEAFRAYPDVLPFMIARKFGSGKWVQPIIDYLAPQIEKSPFPVVTLYDYLWWLNFSLKWQHVALRLIAFAPPDARLDLGENLIHFFSSADFQKWSIANHSSKIKTSWKTYKYVAKEIIFDFHPDAHYLLNKEKEQSLKDAILETPTWLDHFKRPFRNLIYREF